MASGGWSTKQSVIFALSCGVVPFLLNVMADGWPDWSALQWLVYLGGFAVILGAALVAEKLVAARKDRAGTPPDGSG